MTSACWRLEARLPEEAVWRVVSTWPAGPGWAARGREELLSTEAQHPTCTLLRVVSPRGTPGPAHVVASDGIPRRVRYGAKLPSTSPPLALRRDPAAWWAACRDGRDMLAVAGYLVVHGDRLHRAVVLAACACARTALPYWEARYPNDTRPPNAIQVTERWARGEASIEEVMVAAEAVWAAVWMADGAEVAAVRAARAARAASAAARWAPWAARVVAWPAAEWATQASVRVAAAESVSVRVAAGLAHCAGLTREHVPMREVLLRLARP